ncbi:hypothetical protein P170DRAFT_408496 [Aspergillus steynii IBT 23096]|uniref:Aminoglycoside phosphotransferase domain-containing protein n=1 Tax=Aspergillus steynii IBT 23096 TaxID=1392250 RepID=A0A2I2G8Z6_9EURO|nr:uncharacterized protein P170DRAFT_408496 [Aspergillus steynii IBT 23096]PLB49352.1 hypothetical protein P170DRAFT_408496 [Aspergillus steynii IBT 23096]
MPRQVTTLPLLRGTTTLEAALKSEEDILLDLDLPEQRVDFFVSLYSNRDEIERIASYHLGLERTETCRIGGVNEWVHGSFNVCIPLYVGERELPEKRALIRFPLPYKVGEFKHPGNVDEKLRCEAATFIWMEEHCPEIPIPQLWGFGLVGGQSFTKPQNTPLRVRFFWSFKQFLTRLLGHPLPCPYVRHQRSALLETGYLVMEDVGNSDVQMLSETWDEHRSQQDKRRNLFKGLSRIMLSLSRIPLPRIGSWTLDSNGVLQLSNRPLTLRLHQLENGGIPTNISRSLTYSAADAYYHDLLSCHDSRIRHQPNSITDEEDARAQMARLTMMRALIPHFSDREYRSGPFFYRLTDLHPSNLFVDSNWNIKAVIDLEWACSLPAETLRPPYWLTGRSIDELTGKHLETFRRAHDEFVDIFEQEEKLFPPITVNDVSFSRTDLMRRSSQVGAFWYFHALDSPKGLFNLFGQHVYPRFISSRGIPREFSEVASGLWAPDGEDVIAHKLRDKEGYEELLRQRFEEAADGARDKALGHEEK